MHVCLGHNFGLARVRPELPSADLLGYVILFNISSSTITILAKQWQMSSAIHLLLLALISRVALGKVNLLFLFLKMVLLNL